ncbi:protein of unknown function [Hyphomicrobium sp. 1Nfss2.1]
MSIRSRACASIGTPNASSAQVSSASKGNRPCCPALTVLELIGCPPTTSAPARPDDARDAAVAKLTALCDTVVATHTAGHRKCAALNAVRRGDAQTHPPALGSSP